MAPTDGEDSVDLGTRTLAYLQVGDPNGPLVLHNHGGPSSRLEARVFEFAVTGWSEGGPWALAAAAYLDPARLVHVTAGPAPFAPPRGLEPRTVRLTVGSSAN
jgi:hypothetical protein